MSASAALVQATTQLGEQLADTNPAAIENLARTGILKQNGFATSFTQRVLDEYRGIYETGTPEEVALSLAKVGSVVLSQMLTTVAEVTPRQYRERNMQSWQGKLLGKAPYSARDVARFHWSEIAFQDARSLQVPVLGTVRNIDAEVRQAEFSSYRYGRGIEVALDTILTAKGMKMIMTGMNQLVEGALLTKAIVMTQEFAEQKLYEIIRLKRCKTPADYEQYRIAANAEYGVFNKAAEHPFATIQQRCVQETPKATSNIDTWIFPQHLLNDARNERKEAKDYAKTGRPLSWKGSTDNESIQQVDSVMGDSATIYPLPNTIADTPLEQSLSTGIMFLMGQSPYTRVPRTLDPRNYDIKAASFATESYNLVEMEQAIMKLGLFDQSTGGVNKISPNSGDFNKKDEADDPFQVPDDSSDPGSGGKTKATSYRPIELVGEYNLRNKRTLHGHFEMLFNAAAKQLGRTPEQCNQIISQWLSVVRQSDMEPFESLSNLKLKDNAALDKNRYGIPIAKVTAAFTSFASGFDSLMANARFRFTKEADDSANIVINEVAHAATDPNAVHVAASQFLELLVAAYNIETAIHKSKLFAANLSPPEVLTKEMPEIGVWYTHFIEACPSIGPHLQLFFGLENSVATQGNPVGKNVEAAFARVAADFTRVTGATHAPNSSEQYDQMAGIVDVLNNVAAANKDAYGALVTITKTMNGKQPIDILGALVAQWPTAMAKYQNMPGLKQLKMLVTATGANKNTMAYATTLAIPRRRAQDFWAWARTHEDWSLQTGSLVGDEGAVGATHVGRMTREQIYAKEHGADFDVAGTAGRMYSRSTSSTQPASMSGVGGDEAALALAANKAYREAYNTMYKAAQHTVFQQHFKLLTETANASLILMGLPTLFATFDRDCNIRAVRHGIMPLVNVLLWQTPVFHVSGIVGLVPGAETGLVNETHLNIAMGLSVPTKNVQVSMTYNLGVFIFKPENVYNVRGVKFNGVIGGAGVGNDQLGTKLAERADQGFFVDEQGNSVSLLPIAIAIDCWPEDKCITSVINAYPALGSNDDNRPTNGGTISTGYRNNQMYVKYRRGLRAYKDPVVSPGTWLSMSENGQFDVLHKDKGIFREFGDPARMHRFMHGQRSGDVNAY